MASTASRAIAPASDSVSAGAPSADSVSPIAAPAAASSPVSSTATPTATSQPKNAAPQLMPPYSSRWRARTSRIVVGGGTGGTAVDAGRALAVLGGRDGAAPRARFIGVRAIVP